MKTNRLTLASINGANPDANYPLPTGEAATPGFIDRIRTRVKTKIEAYKAEARRERDIQQVLEMDDSQLKDIGLSHADRSGLRSGRVSFTDLNDRREAYRRQFD